MAMSEKQEQPRSPTVFFLICVTSLCYSTTYRKWQHRRKGKESNPLSPLLSVFAHQVECVSVKSGRSVSTVSPLSIRGGQN